MQTVIKREGLKRSKFYAKKKETLAAMPKYEAKAVAKFVRISPRKARSVVNSIRGKNVSEAFNLLEFSPKKAARIVRNVLKSAVANATNNYGLSEDNLYVSSCYVTDGPRMKRVWPRGRGRADIIQKRMSHVTVVVRDREKEKESNAK